MCSLVTVTANSEQDVERCVLPVIIHGVTTFGQKGLVLCL